MAITFNHNDKLYVSGSNVGIGTTNMYARLNVKATSHNNGISVNRQADNTAAIYIGNDGGNNPILAANNADMLFGRDLSGTFTERMRLTNTGNLGIGTTNPSCKLEVKGASGTLYDTQLKIVASEETGAADTGGSLSFVGHDGNNERTHGAVRGRKENSTVGDYGGYLAFDTRANNAALSEKMRILGNGNVGIGKTDPSAPLHINGGSTNQVVKIQSNSAPYIRFKEGGTDVGFIQFGTDTYISNQKDGTLNFRTNNTDKMTILSNGRVGIGTTSPGAKLDVDGRIIDDTDTLVLSTRRTKDITSSNYFRFTRYSTVEDFNDQWGAKTGGSGTISVVDDSTAPAEGCFEISGSYYVDGGSDYIKVNTNEDYTFEMYIKYVSGTDTDQRLYLGWTMYNSAKSSFGNNNRYWAASALQVDANSYESGDWVKIVGTISGVGTSVGQFLAGTEYVKPLALFNYSDNNNVIRVCGFKLYKSSNYTTELKIVPRGAKYSTVTDFTDYFPTIKHSDGSGYTGMRLHTGQTHSSWGDVFIGASNDWGSSYHPTLGSNGGSAGSLVMIQNPHTPFRTDNAVSGYSGRSGLRMARNSSGDWWDAGLAGDFFHIYRNGTGEFLRVTNTGNVGIGTTDPGAKLDVNSTGIAATPTVSLTNTSSAVFNHTINALAPNLTAGENNVFIIGKEGNTKNAGYIGYTWNADADNSNVLTFGHWASDNLMNLTGDGNLGIGTTDPGGKLHLEGNFETSKALVIKGTYGNGTEHYFRTHGVNSEDLSIYNGTTRTLSMSGGNVVVSNGYLKTQSGNVVRSEYDSNDYSQLESNSSGGVFKAVAGGDTNILLRSYSYSHFTNSLGIGVTIPSYKLHVSGDVYSEKAFRLNKRIHYNFNGATFDGENTDGEGRRYTIGRVYYSKNHWGYYGTLRIEVNTRYPYNGTQTFLVQHSGNFAGIKCIEAHGSSSYLSNVKLELGSETDTGVDYSNYDIVYKDIYLYVDRYLQARVYAEVDAHAFDYDKTTITSGEYYMTTLFTTTANQDKTSVTGFSNYQTVQLVSNGNNKAYIAGNLGVGTDNPSRRLHVSAGNTDIAAKFENTSSNSTVLHLETTGDGKSMYFQTDHIYVSSGAMHFGNETGDLYLRPGSSSGVGINTTNPTGLFNSYISAARQVTHNGNGGDLSVISDNNSAPVFYVKGTGTADLVNIFDDTTEVFTILDGGNVGIGTTDPSHTLTVAGDGLRSYGTISSISNGALLGRYSGGTGIDSGELILATDAKTGWDEDVDEFGRIRFYSTDSSGIGARDAAVIKAVNGFGDGSTTTTFSGELAFFTSAYNANVAEAVRIDGDGNVGIGTTSPGAKLEVFGTGNTLRLDSAANGSKEILFRNVGTGTATIKTDGDLKLYVEDAGKNILFDTTGGEKMRIKSDGTIQFNSYGAGFLQTDANGNITAGAVTTSDTLDDVTDNGNSTTNSIILGDTTTNGTMLVRGSYSNGNIVVIGGMKSSGGAMIGYGVKPDTSTNHGFVSSSSFTLERAAYYQQGNRHRWYAGASQNVVTGNAVTMSETMRLDFDKLGLSTSSPASLIHLGKPTNGSNIITFGEASIGGPHGLDFYGDDATRTKKYSIYYRTGTENISMETSDGTKRFEINQSGAVTLNEAFTFPTADGSAGAALVTNGSGYLSWNAGYQQYTPVGWGVLNNQTYTSTGSNISSNSTQAQAGTTPVQRNSATEFEATKAGWYEISYSFIVKNNYANRAMIGAYMTVSTSGGGGVISGSHSTQYVRYSTYGQYAQIQNTFYYYTSASSTNFYLLAYLLSGSMNMTTQSISQSMISFRYINNDIT